MKTIITSLALCTGMAVNAQNDVVPVQSEPAPFEQSIYDECLMVAGAQSWEALHLDADQVARVTDLQNRYRASAKAAKEQAEAEAKAAAKKGGSKKAVTTEPAKTAAPVVANEAVVAEPTMKSETAEPVGDQSVAQAATTEAGDVSAAAPEAMMELTYSAVDTELRTILTPAQLAVWERRCDTRTSMNP
ncbi:MAG: hypothetical protein JNM62_12450 [Flavobacteriales bacterium]|nr:hypothetical protein [Flavobacteriales bacterium]